jgi:hypothetical protein
MRMFGSGLSSLMIRGSGQGVHRGEYDDIAGPTTGSTLVYSNYGCFERSGFDPTRICTRMCKRPCQHDSAFPSSPYLYVMLANLTSDGLVPEELVRKCPSCGSEMFGNVRGRSWFLHPHKYKAQNQALEACMESLLVDSNLNVVILEIGAGFNTPMVTRCPEECPTTKLSDTLDILDTSIGKLS